jgi:hypothetical protein
MNGRGIVGIVAMMVNLGSAAASEAPVADTGAPDARAWFAALAPDATVEGWRATAVYLDEAGQSMGGRFVHATTGFLLDLVAIQSVPQAFLWVNTHPTSDMGEPHTQEHLLLGKGNRGRYVSSLEDMSLTYSSAFTEQLRTCYHFNNNAGAEPFYRVFEARLDALLHPDYTDEEIRREVRNFGVTEVPGEGRLALEERGTVYNEMTTSFERPWSRLNHALSTLMYGPDHPLAYVSGGLPAAIREMKPEHIRKFHHDTHHLGNMGMIGSFPKEMPPAQVLARLDAILERVQPAAEAAGRPVRSVEDLPQPAMAPAGEVRVVDYPHQNAERPGLLVLGWAPDRTLPPREQVLLQLFVDNIASDPTTNLYKLLVDTTTATLRTDAKSVFGWVRDEPGHPVVIGLGDVAAAYATPEQAAAVRKAIVDEIAGIAAFDDGSAELAEFNGRIRSRIIEARRRYSVMVSSPPGFGQRGTGSQWMDHLGLIARREGFRQSLVLEAELDHAEKLLDGGENFWRLLLASWRITGATPYVVAARANPDLIGEEADQRRKRAATELARLQAVYGTADEQETLRRYRQDYDTATVALDEIAARVETPRFVANPPLTLDPLLDWRLEHFDGGVPHVVSTFEMSRATSGLALRLDGVPPDQQYLLAVLPQLLTQVGVIEDGTPVPYEVMSERLRQEVSRLDAAFASDARTARVELLVRGGGNTIAESQRALQWMRLVLAHPDWRPANLARLRDVVDQALAGLRNTMQRPEEYWVNDPALAYRRQDHPLLLATGSFLTRSHNAHRLRWMLKDPGDPRDRQAIESWLTSLAGAGATSDRAGLAALLGSLQGREGAGAVPESLTAHLAAYQGLSEVARGNAAEAAKDLELTLADLPDGSLRADWEYLCAQMRRDLLVEPAAALAELDAVRQRLLVRRNARTFLIGSRQSQEQLQHRWRELLGVLDDRPADPPAQTGAGLVDMRLRQRQPDAVAPVFVGLVHPNTQGGVILNSAPGTSYADGEREALLRYLAMQLYGGGGAHGIFMKTWGAGLAYSNGLSSNPAAGRVAYYAERCPELPQTLQFVIAELRSARPDPALVEYAVAQAFGAARSALAYEARGEAMAQDLAVGLPPDVVSRFRTAILELRGLPDLSRQLHDRLPAVSASVLPGFVPGPPPAAGEGGVYMVIGPERQLDLYDQYLKSAVDPAAKLHRLYPRDFWMVE